MRQKGGACRCDAERREVRAFSYHENKTVAPTNITSAATGCSFRIFTSVLCSSGVTDGPYCGSCGRGAGAGVGAGEGRWYQRRSSSALRCIGVVTGTRTGSVAGTGRFVPQSQITPHCPQQNGMVERMIRTLKEQCTHRHRFETLQHASRVIGDWIQFYNHKRPHQALKMQTPAAAFALAA